MPFGLAKDIGGDSPENVRKMESCIHQVMARNPSLTKEQAIRICKDSIQKSKRKKKGRRRRR